MDNAGKCSRCGASVPVGAPEGLCPRCLLAGVAELTDSGVREERPSAPALERVAAAFPHLEIVELIGQGGMGCVFKARQPQLNRFVALKILPEALARDPAFAARFAREAQALAALNHPNIVTVHDFGESGGFYFLLMEFVDGVNLRQALHGGRFTPEQALAIVPPICEALQFAHERGIVHRDIKPENLLLDREGRVKIADFGIARMVNATAREDERPAGTPRYAAPEQIGTPRQTDHRADIYSLGVVLYEMLTGEVPGAKLEPPSRKVQVDVRLDRVVLRALEKSPELRWQTAAELGTKLQEIREEPSPGPNAKTQTRKALAVAGLCLPSALFTWFILAGYGRMGIDLDADVQAWLGLIGFPLSAGCGLLLAWLAGGFAAPGAHDQLDPTPKGWSPRALIAGFFWGTSVLFMGGGMVMFSLISQDAGGWNPAAAELVFVLIFSGGGLLAVLASTSLGFSAVRLFSREPQLWRGWGPAFTASWFWPGTALALIALLFALPPRGRALHVHALDTQRAALEQVKMLKAIERLESLAPVVVKTTPVSGSKDVSPGETELRVSFSKPMMDQSWSWVEAWQGSVPEMLSEPRYVNDQTCTVKVRLKPGRTYAYWLNSEEFGNFQDNDGQPAAPYLLIFETRQEGNDF